MANHKTGAQRRNDRMDKIFANSKELNEKYHGKDSFGTQAKSKALDKKKHYTGHYQADAVGRVKAQSPKQVEKKRLNEY